MLRCRLSFFGLEFGYWVPQISCFWYSRRGLGYLDLPSAGLAPRISFWKVEHKLDGLARKCRFPQIALLPGERYKSASGPAESAPTNSPHADYSASYLQLALSVMHLLNSLGKAPP
jgi:hypothetical protein